MKYVDISNPKRIDRIPDKTIQILSDGTTVEKGYKIININYDYTLKKMIKNWDHIL